MWSRCDPCAEAPARRERADVEDVFEGMNSRRGTVAVLFASPRVPPTSRDFLRWRNLGFLAGAYCVQELHNLPLLGGIRRQLEHLLKVSHRLGVIAKMDSGVSSNMKRLHMSRLDCEPVRCSLYRFVVAGRRIADETLKRPTVRQQVEIAVFELIPIDFVKHSVKTGHGIVGPILNEK